MKTNKFFLNQKEELIIKPKRFIDRILYNFIDFNFEIRNKGKNKVMKYKIKN